MDRDRSHSEAPLIDPFPEPPPRPPDSFDDYLRFIDEYGSLFPPPKREPAEPFRDVRL